MKWVALLGSGVLVVTLLVLPARAQKSQLHDADMERITAAGEVGPDAQAPDPQQPLPDPKIYYVDRAGLQVQPPQLPQPPALVGSKTSFFEQVNLIRQGR